MVVGKIYKIITSQSNECYVGSTFDELRYRFRRHKHNYKAWKNDKQTDIHLSSCYLFDKYGVNNCKMVLIKEYEVIDRKHLEVYETLWINKLHSINHNVPFAITKMSNKTYKIKNKDTLWVFQKWTCEICNMTMNQGKKKRHLKSKKHYPKNNTDNKNE